MAEPKRVSTTEPVLLLHDIEVRFQVVEDRVTSFKEYTLQRLAGRLERRELSALNGVSLALAPGEIVGVVGRNGAGKTTMLRVAAGVLTPTSGRVRTVGRVVPLLGVGAGFQPDLTGRENALLGMTMLGIGRRDADRLLDSVVDFAELDGVIDRPIRQYSAGMVARLGFAVGTVRRADVLLLDEVLAVGDERFQQKCLRCIEGACASGTSVLLVSHSASAISHCHRALWIDDGRVAADGLPGEVLAEYRNNGDGGPGNVTVTVDDEIPTSAQHPSLPESEPVTDVELVSILRHRCGDPGTPFYAVRLFAELRDVALTRGFDLDRVLEIGPRSLPLLQVCFASTGARRVASVNHATPPGEDEIELLKSYLGSVGGIGWWRWIADAYPGGTLESDLLWNNVDLVRRAAKVERVESRPSGRFPFADASFSFVYSVSSLAHVAEPEIMIEESARVLEPGGGAVHEIVFSNLDNPDTLGDLKTAEPEWRIQLAERESSDWLFDVPPGVPPGLAYAHRWRASDFVGAMEAAGFGDVLVEPIIRLRPELVEPETLAEPFRSKSVDDLAVVMARITARRKQTEASISG